MLESAADSIMFNSFSRFSGVGFRRDYYDASRVLKKAFFFSFFYSFLSFHSLVVLCPRIMHLALFVLFYLF